MLRKLSVLVVAGALSSVFVGGAFATGHSSGGTNGPIGSAITPATSVIDRVIELRPGIKYVNVTAGERILFKIGNKSFAWKFDEGHPHANFNLSEIAPKDIDVPAARVYVGENVYDHSA